MSGQAPELVRYDSHVVKRCVDAILKVEPGYEFKSVQSVDSMSDKCGSFVTISCKNHRHEGDGHTHRARPNSCGHVECRVCGDKEVRREVKTIMSRFRALARSLRHQGYETPDNINDSKYWTHSTMSPPKSQHHKIFTPAGFRAMRAKAERYAVRMGYVGAYIVFHLVHEGDGTARERRERLEAWQRGEIQLEFWPHFHIYGLRPSMGSETTEEFHEKTSWVFRAFFDKRKRYRNVYKTLLYELGHASAPVVDGRSGQIASPFGLLHPYYLKKTDNRVKEPETCKDCGDECYILDHLGEVMRDIHGEPMLAMRLKGDIIYSIPDARIANIEKKYGLVRDLAKKRYFDLAGYIAEAQ